MQIQLNPPEALTLELRGGFGEAKDVPLERVVRAVTRLLARYRPTKDATGI